MSGFTSATSTGRARHAFTTARSRSLAFASPPLPKTTSPSSWTWSESLLGDIRQLRSPPRPAHCVPAAETDRSYIRYALFQRGMSQNQHAEAIGFPRTVPEQMHDLHIHSSQ
eukprot:2483418-Prymnesium_polylepis.1